MAFTDLVESLSGHVRSAERLRLAAAAYEADASELHVGPTGEPTAICITSGHGIRLLAAWLRRHAHQLRFRAAVVAWPVATPESCAALSELAAALPTSVTAVSVDGYADASAVCSLAAALSRSGGGSLNCCVANISQVAAALRQLPHAAEGGSVAVQLQRGLADAQTVCVRLADAAAAEWLLPVGSWVRAEGLRDAELCGSVGRVLRHRAGAGGDRVGVSFEGCGREAAVRPECLLAAAPPAQAAVGEQSARAAEQAAAEEAAREAAAAAARDSERRAPARPPASAAYDPRRTAGPKPGQLRPASMLQHFGSAMRARAP